MEQLNTLLSTVVQWAADAIEIATPDARLIFVNEAFERLTGYTLEEVKGRTPAEFLRSERQDPSVYDTMWETIQSKRHYTGRLCRRIKNGEHRIFEITVAPVLNGNQEIVYFTAISRDITDEMLDEQQKLELLEQVTYLQKRESLGLMAGRFAHDFNNLLTSIGGCLDLLEDARDEERRLLMANAQLALSRASELTHQMLLYSGGKVATHKRVNINRIAEEMKILFHVPLDRQIRLVFNLTEPLPEVMGDRTQLGQVMLNLVTNAADAIGRREGTISVSTGEHRLTRDGASHLLHNSHLPPGRYVSLEVRDTGTGISASLLPKIFDPFVTTKKHGHGLGLSSVLGIVRAHGGDVRVESRLGAGTRFLVFLPLVEKLARHAPVPTRLPQRRRQVLVVESDALVRSVLAKSLELARLQVMPLSDGREAWDVYQENPKGFDLVLLDLLHGSHSEGSLLSRIKLRNPEQRVARCGRYDNAAELRPELVLERPFSAQKLVSEVLALMES